jgi:hypothetical protein
MLRIVTDDPSVNQANFNTAQLLATAARNIVDFTVPDYVPFTTTNRTDGLDVYREHYTQSGVAPNDGTPTPGFGTGHAFTTLGLTGESGGDMGGCIKGPFVGFVTGPGGVTTPSVATAPGPVSSSFDVCN